MPSRRCPSPVRVPGSAFAGFRFPPDVILLAVRWYLRFALSYRDVWDIMVAGPGHQLFRVKGQVTAYLALLAATRS